MSAITALSDSCHWLFCLVLWPTSAIGALRVFASPKWQVFGVATEVQNCFGFPVDVAAADATPTDASRCQPTVTTLCTNRLASFCEFR